MSWLWKRKPPSEETREAQRRLHAVERDDERVRESTARTRRVLRGNNFANDVRKALGGSG